MKSIKIMHVHYIILRILFICHAIEEKQSFYYDFNQSDFVENRDKITSILNVLALISHTIVYFQALAKSIFFQTAPYGYEKKSKDKLEGNDRYEGFTIDLIERLSQLLGFSYEFAVEKSYGKKQADGKFNGMVQQLQEEVSTYVLFCHIPHILEPCWSSGIFLHTLLA